MQERHGYEPDWPAFAFCLYTTRTNGIKVNICQWLILTFE